MSDDDLELIHGSGNVYRDLKRPHPDLEQARALVAAQIVRTLDARGLTTRDAEAATGVAHSEFSRIRNAQPRRFALDRLMTILETLDGNLGVRLVMQPRRPEARAT
ncbi:XRE family transcriptional regulator [Methylobacterium sp. 17Sr1-1]|uniref:helix-turn-helix domain-containing protein n=1 Tax=Methylobacterium sp. 17Sr1-1 TaxID=2202826 RepID=UPI000D6ED3F7|nr:XRE family transcriptional regulator [Methylobacterium sp. 17Sr1-1]AWN53956.1 XRE family transcriptional regulator [Methylobacterium sp. 17Sr1-1]